MRTLTKILFPLMIVGMLAACTTTGSSSTTTDTGQSPEAQYQEPNYYLDFDDIMLPKEIDYVTDGSYRLDNAKFKASIMKFKGRVEILELVQFFLNNMAKDNWTLISNNKSSESYIMNFEKYNKSCVIQVDDKFATSATTIFAVEVKDSTSDTKK